MRWYRVTRERHYMESAQVALRCVCGHLTGSITAALQHRADYRAPGILSVRMLLDQTFKWERQSRPNEILVSNLILTNYRGRAPLYNILS